MNDRKHIFDYIASKFELKVTNSTTEGYVTGYDLLSYCGKTLLIIGYFACWITESLGGINIVNSAEQNITDATIWQWIIGSIQKPCKN